MNEYKLSLLEKGNKIFPYTTNSIVYRYERCFYFNPLDNDEYAREGRIYCNEVFNYMSINKRIEESKKLQNLFAQKESLGDISENINSIYEMITKCMRWNKYAMCLNLGEWEFDIIAWQHTCRDLELHPIGGAKKLMEFCNNVISTTYNEVDEKKV